MLAKSILPAALAASLLGGAEVPDKFALPVEGNPSSHVQVVVYEDLQCPDCAFFRFTMEEKLLPRFASRVAFIHRDFPLAQHAWARQAAIAGRYFAMQDPALGLRYRVYILHHQGAITAANFRDKIAAFARENHVPADDALRSLGDPALAAAVQHDVDEGVTRGITRTPTVLVGDRTFVEHFPLEELAAAIDEALR